MLNKQAIEDLSNKIKDMMAQSPAADLEKNLRALLQGGFAKLDLVSREEFDVQAEALRHARDQLASLEEKVAMLEKSLKKQNEA
jgi:ubiquinone biosynthesis accessory factor UbiK